HTDPRMVGLSPRLRQTLSLLLAGHSEKAITARLSLSRHTVHQYIKMLHCRLGVCSRTELLAKWAAAAPSGALILDIPGFPRVPAAAPPVVANN
ncbi:transcriptional regulator, LuxR family protein, partial [mine drainage metagenome]